MKSRRVSFLLLLAVIFWSASVVMVVVNMDVTRTRLQDTNPGAINYLVQTYRNVDVLQERLFDLIISNDIDPLKQWQSVQTQFDIIWSAFSIVNVSAPGSRDPLPGQFGLDRESEKFLQSNDAFFSNPLVPATSDVVKVLKSMRVLTAKTHTLGLEYFNSATHFRDEINTRLNELYHYLWISALLLLMTTSLLVWHLFKLNAASVKMFRDAQNSEAQLTQVVDELRSGRLEQKAKDSFLAAASHDLRQPLHALGLFVNALEKKVVPPEGPVILDKIKQSTAALNSLFNSLLDISRLDAGVVEVVPEHFYIGDVLNNLNEEFAEVAAQRGLEFEVSHNDKVAFTDGVLLRRILCNLIDNAVVHSSTGKIMVSCVQKGKYLNIEVSDQGPGIPVEEQPYVFSEYYQLDNPERDRSKGLGLGLSIVKRLCELLGIEVELNSKPGIGTTFLLRVPVGKNEDLLMQGEPERGGISTFDFNGQLVLVIDDEPDVRDGMELVLREANCRVFSAESARSACDQIVELDLIPRLIIADYRLREGKTGLQAVEAVREELNDEIPALIITGDTSPERVREVSETGMQLMHKPVVPARLFDMISSVLAEPLMNEVKSG